MTALYFMPNDCPAGREKLLGAYSRARQLDITLQRVGAADAPKNIRKLLDFWKPDAAIVESGDDTEYFDPSAFGRLPVVYIDRDPASLPRSARVSIIDSEALSAAAARELLRLDCAAYAMVPTAKPTFWGLDRTKYYREAIKLNGFEPAIFPRSGSNEKLDTRALLKWLGGLPRPCGIFAATDQIGGQLLATISLLGAKVPDDFLVIGTDNDTEICENTHPSLTSIAVDFRAAGALAVDLLTIRGGGIRKFGVREIVHRASTFRPRTNYPFITEAMDLIRRQATNGLKARDVLSRTGLSRRLAEIRFKQATGMTVLDAIRERRFEEAMNLVNSRTVPLSLIPGMCGWESAAVFRRYFKARTGRTMREFRS